MLCQHCLVLSSGGSSLVPPAEELYEFNEERCLLRLRWGKILDLSYEKSGDIVSTGVICSRPVVLESSLKVMTQGYQIIKQVLLFGKLQLPDIIHACGGQYDPARQFLASMVHSETLIPVNRGRGYYGSHHRARQGVFPASHRARIPDCNRGSTGSTCSCEQILLLQHASTERADCAVL